MTQEQLDYADELKSGETLFTLSFSIAKAIEPMLKKLDATDSVAAIEAQVRKATFTPRRQSRQEPRGQDRKQEKRGHGSGAKNLFCANCDFLRSALKVPEIRTDHLPSRCPRTEFSNRARLVEDTTGDFDEEVIEDEEENE